MEFFVHFKGGEIVPVSDCHNIIDAVTRAIENTTHKFSEVIRVELDTDDENRRFKKLFNDERALVSLMTQDALDEHLEELKGIAFEAKARLEATQAEMQERNDE